MIVLTEKQKNDFLSAKSKVKLDKGSDYVPVEIKGGLWTLPDEVLSDANFGPLKESFNKLGATIRDISEDELIITKL